MFALPLLAATASKKKLRSAARARAAAKRLADAKEGCGVLTSTARADRVSPAWRQRPFVPTKLVSESLKPMLAITNGN